MFHRVIGKMLLGIMLISAQAMAATGSYTLEFGGARDASELMLSIGKSQIIYSPRSLEQVVIGDPEIADIKLLSSRQVLILGKKPGHTNLVFRDKKRALNAVIDVVVGYELGGIKRKIYEVLPHERLIEIRGANDSVMLSGEVSSLASMDKAVSIAASYVPKDKVINMLQVGGGQQVMLEVMISEMHRGSLRQLGFYGSSYHTNSDGAKLDVLFGSGPAAGSFLTLNGTTADGLLKINMDALESKGLSKVLAEPNIVALSGQEASFLAGGELPIPVAQSSSAAGGDPVITVDYKEFGVGLKFTPTVLSGGKINLKLNSEVSGIDTSSTINIGNSITLPKFNTRRAGTTVEVGDGQSFAIAGLIQSDMKNAINQVPGLGDIPILGALFRSTDFNRDETELVMIVTPKLVKPVHKSNLRAPTDNFIAPNWFDQYLLGSMEKYKQAKSEKSEGTEGSEVDAEMTESDIEQSEEGVEGSFGHDL